MGAASHPVRPLEQRKLKRKPSSLRQIVSAISSASRLTRSSSSIAKLHSAARVPGRWGVLGVSNSLVDDFTFHCLDMPWRSLLMLVLAVYFSIAVLFGLAFWLLLTYSGSDGEEAPHLVGDIPRQLSLIELCFWFSVNNLITIGFGNVHPGTTPANMLCTTEHFGGIMLSSILLGLVVTKASLPTSKIIFSKVCLITKRNGVPHLLVRVGNTRGNFLLNPEIRISYLKRLVTIEGEVTFSGSRLDYADPPAMAPTVNIAHGIDEQSPLHKLTPEDIIDQEGGIYLSISATDSNSLQGQLMSTPDMGWLYPLRCIAHKIDHRSPLYGKTPADIEADSGYISCLLAGVDDHFYETVYARQIYRAADIRWNHRFKDMLVQRNNKQFVDFNNLHETVPIAHEPMTEDLADAKSKAMWTSEWRQKGSYKELGPSGTGADDGPAGSSGYVSKSQPGFRAPWNLPAQGEEASQSYTVLDSQPSSTCAMQQAKEASERADEAFRQRVSVDVDRSPASQVKRRPSKKLEELTGQTHMGDYDKPG